MYYIDYWFIVICTITGCVSIPGFASLVGILIGITSSATGLKICVITAWIKNYKSVNKKNKKEHDEIILLTKSKSHSTGVLIYKDLIDSTINHGEFVLLNGLKEFYDMKRN